MSSSLCSRVAKDFQANHAFGTCKRLPQTKGLRVYAVLGGKPELRKPEMKRPERKVEEVRKLFTEGEEEKQSTALSTAHSTAGDASTSVAMRSVTVEYQRQRAKEMVKYFQNQKLAEEIVKSRVLGWTPQNEIGNGRWVMFGLLVGILTEYATGVDFIDQLKLMVTNLGIADLD